MQGGHQFRFSPGQGLSLGQGGLKRLKIIVVITATDSIPIWEERIKVKPLANHRPLLLAHSLSPKGLAFPYAM